MRLSDGGSQAPFSQSSLTTALDGEGSGRVYLRGGIFSWQNSTWMANHERAALYLARNAGCGIKQST